MTLRLRRWFSSILSLLFGSTIIGACAPAPAYMGPPPYNVIKGQVKDKDSAQVIAGIRVSLIYYNYTNSCISSSNGLFSFYTYDENITLTGEDIDGNTNGVYFPTNYTLTITKTFPSYTTNIDILMTTNTNG